MPVKKYNVLRVFEAYKKIPKSMDISWRSGVMITLMEWLVIELDEEVHVVPNLDGHIMNKDCKCGLVIEVYDKDLVIHNVVH